MLAAGAAAVPLVAVAGVLLVIGAASGAPSPPPAGCGASTIGVVGIGGATVGAVSLDAEQMANALTIVTVTAQRGLPFYAAAVAVTTSITEASLHNSAVETDHDSEGLFQQRISIYTKAVADDPVRSTGAFLERLVGVADWEHTAIGVDAQTVQISAFPERYEPNAPLGTALASQLWPSARAATQPAPPPRVVLAADHGPAVRGPAAAGSGAPASVPRSPQETPRLPGAPTPSPVGTTTSPPPADAVVVAGPPCQGAAPPGGGPPGNNVAGTTTIPVGLVLTGSPRGRGAVAFALRALGQPYVYGAAGPSSWDCSGLTMGAWASQGVALPHFTGAQAHAGLPVALDLSTAVGGDLVLIPGGDGTVEVPGHVGMVAGYTDGLDGRHLWLVHAPMPGIGVELTDAWEWRGQIVAVRHVG